MSTPEAPTGALALHGGQPTFDRIRPIGQLAAPASERLADWLDRAIERESGTGASLIPELEAALCELHDVEHCITFSNACIALIALTELLGRVPGGEVILPAFTYMGLPHLVQWTGHRPRFADVLAEEHTLDPESVRSVLTKQTALILGVHQVQAACRVEAFDALSEEFGVPVIYDAVHGLGNTHRGESIGRFGRAEVFSLHATKLLNGFEGGYVTTRDGDLADRLRALRGTRASEVPKGLGLPGRLPEFHAAFVLAGLEDLPETIDRNRERYETYRQQLRGVEGLTVLDYPEDGERRNFEFTLLWVHESFGYSRDEVVEALLAEGTRARGYYGPPVHLTEHRPAWMEPPHLPVTEHLAQHIVQLPVGEHVSIDDVKAICRVLRKLAGRPEPGSGIPGAQR